MTKQGLRRLSEVGREAISVRKDFAADICLEAAGARGIGFSVGRAIFPCYFQ